MKQAPHIPPLIVALTLLAPLLALVMCWGALDAMPHVSDEVVYTLQSKLFAAGTRVGPAGDVPSMLTYPFWVSAPVSYGVFPPGWPALLALGQAAGSPWLVNPLLAGALPLLTWALAREAVEEPVAQLAAGVMALSPGVLLMAASRMSHTSVLVALLALAVVVARGRDAWPAWLLAGLAAGYVVLTRPYDAALVAGPLMLAGLLRAGPRAALMLLGPAAAAALLGWDNHALTGSATTFPTTPYFDQMGFDMGLGAGCNRLGFGPGHGCVLGGHSPERALLYTQNSLELLDRLLLGLPGLGLSALLGAAVLGKRALPLLVLVLLVVGGYALYWSPGAAYGARFYHPLYIALPLLVSAGLYKLLRQWSWALLVPVCAWGSVQVAQDMDEPYWCVGADLSHQLQDQGIEEGVLFLHSYSQRGVGWGALLTELQCVPALKAGDGFWLQDPTASQGGLQVRHRLPGLEQTHAYMQQMQPGAQAWAADQDIGAGTWTLHALTQDGWVPLAP